MTWNRKYASLPCIQQQMLFEVLRIKNEENMYISQMYKINFTQYDFIYDNL